MKRALVGATVVIAFIAIPIAVKVSNAKALVRTEQGRIELRHIQRTILASGNFAFRQELQLSSEVIGKVFQVLVAEGDKVVRGQVLLRLDPSSYRSEVAQQAANLRSAEIAIERSLLNVANQRRIVERSQRLAQAKFINVSKYEEAKHEWELATVDRRASAEAFQQADALLALARERLSKTEVRAPISGTVTAIQIKIGETAVASATGMPGSSLLTIADVGGMMAEVNVDEADIGGVRPGQSARVFPSAFPERPLSGTVERVSMTPKAGPQGRSYVVRLRLETKGLALRTGMTCRVEIQFEGGKPSPAIPLQAVLTEPGAGPDAKPSHYALAVVDGVVRKKALVLGVSDDARQEVLSGLAVGEVVVTGPPRVLRELRDGDGVARGADAAPPAAPAGKS
ncbi:MAG TPA: efflux RND transporter periplasmic adaptor subunit [Telluria sp.]